MIPQNDRSFNYLLGRAPALRELLEGKEDWEIQLEINQAGNLAAHLTRPEFQDTATIITDGHEFSVAIRFPGTAGQYDRLLPAENFWSAWVVANNHAQWWRVKLALL